MRDMGNQIKREGKGKHKRKRREMNGEKRKASRDRRK